VSIDHSERILRQVSQRNAEGCGAGSSSCVSARSTPYPSSTRRSTTFWRQGGPVLARSAPAPSGPRAAPGRSDRRGPPAARLRGDRRDRGGHGPGHSGGVCPSRILGLAGGDPKLEARGQVRAQPERSRGVTAPAASTFHAARVSTNERGGSVSWELASRADRRSTATRRGITRSSCTTPTASNSSWFTVRPSGSAWRQSGWRRGRGRRAGSSSGRRCRCSSGSLIERCRAQITKKGAITGRRRTHGSRANQFR
jgi:hypothetical protein